MEAHRSDPSTSAAHQVGEHLAAARGPADARSIRARAATKRSARSRPDCDGRGCGIEDIELVIPDPPPSRPLGTRRHDRGPLRGAVAALDRAADYGARYAERSARDRSFSRELMRHHGVPDSVMDANEGFWDFIRDTSEPYATDIALVRRRPHPGRRSRPSDPGAARPQHDRHAACRRTQRHGVRRRSSSRRYLVEHRGRAGGRARRDRGPGRGSSIWATSGEPRRCRLTGLLTGHGDPVIDHRRLVRRRFDEHRRRCKRILGVLEEGRPTRTGSPATCGRRVRWPSSRCSSSGRCSATSTFSSTRARSPKRCSTTAAGMARRGSRCASRPTRPLPDHLDTSASPDTLILHPGGQRSAEIN